MNTKVYLHEFRRNNDLALGEVARNLQMKASDLSKIERGVLPLTDDLGRRLAKIYNATVEEIRASVPSAEEVEADESRMLDCLTAMAAARTDAEAMGFKRGNGGRSDFLCPICKRGQLHYSVASVNGHLWGRCSTEGCVSWMQ